MTHLTPTPHLAGQNNVTFFGPPIIDRSSTRLCECVSGYDDFLLHDLDLHKSHLPRSGSVGVIKRSCICVTQLLRWRFLARLRGYFVSSTELSGDRQRQRDREDDLFVWNETKGMFYTSGYMMLATVSHYLVGLILFVGPRSVLRSCVWRSVNLSSCGPAVEGTTMLVV